LRGHFAAHVGPGEGFKFSVPRSPLFPPGATFVRLFAASPSRTTLYGLGKDVCIPFLSFPSGTANSTSFFLEQNRAVAFPATASFSPLFRDKSRLPLSRSWAAIIRGAAPLLSVSLVCAGREPGFPVDICRFFFFFFFPVHGKSGSLLLFFRQPQNIPFLVFGPHGRPMKGRGSSIPSFPPPFPAYSGDDHSFGFGWEIPFFPFPPLFHSSARNPGAGVYLYEILAAFPLFPRLDRVDVRLRTCIKISLLSLPPPLAPRFEL